MVGSAIVRCLERQGFSNIVTRARPELDLTDQNAVMRFFEQERPHWVFLAAAKVGGILANQSRPAEFISENLSIQTNVIQSARLCGVKRMMFLGSSCIYPRDCPQPIKEEYMMTGPLEPTNRPYAIAKLAGIEMCWAFNRQYGTDYIAVMPTNLYGPNDNYDVTNSHVLPALIGKMHKAKIEGRTSVEVWGTGNVRREFLHADDMASASLFLMKLPSQTFGQIAHSETEAPILNVGCGSDLTIRELAGLIQEVVQFRGELMFDRTKPDGTPRKLLDVSKLKKLGWKPEIDLRQGLQSVYRDFLSKE
jgi:GDP-L-fucose synthase